MDPTAQDVRAGNAVYDPTIDGYVWLPGKDPSQFSPGTTQVNPVWDSGVGADVVTVSTSPKKLDSSTMALLLLFAAWVWITVDE